jgi:NAD(P)H-flavin reductase
MDDFKGEIVEISDETPFVKTLKMRMDKKLDFLPGQYVFVVIEGERLLLRPYSIASSPIDEFLELCVAKVEGGVASKYLHERAVGDSLRIRGPLGKFVLCRTENPLIFIAAGSGIAPFRSMIRFALDSGWKNEIHLLFGVRTKADVIFAKEWEDLEKAFPNFHVVITLSREDGPETGYVQTKINRFSHLKDADVYVCGAGNMVQETMDALEKEGFKNIFVERYN